MTLSCIWTAKANVVWSAWTPDAKCSRTVAGSAGSAYGMYVEVAECGWVEPLLRPGDKKPPVLTVKMEPDEVAVIVTGE